MYLRLQAYNNALRTFRIENLLTLICNRKIQTSMHFEAVTHNYICIVYIYCVLYVYNFSTTYNNTHTFELICSRLHLQSCMCGAAKVLYVNF